MARKGKLRTVFRVMALGAAFVLASQAGGFAQTPSVAGVWWTKSYNPRIVPMDGSEIPFTPEGRAAYEKNKAGLADGSIEDGARRVCLPDGVPRIWSAPYPFEIIETYTQVTLVYETNHVFRVVRTHQPTPPMTDETRFPWYNGHGYGRWEGDTFVIDTQDFNDRTFIDATGVPHSDLLRVTERIRKINDGKQLEVIATIEDPVTFTQPWSARFVFESRPDIRLDVSYTCGDKHRDLSQVEGAPR